VGSSPPCLQATRLYSNNTITEAFRSIWIAKPQETERDSPGSQAPRVPPIRILGAGDQDPFPLTTQRKLTSTQPNGPLFLLQEILAMWYLEISWNEPREQRKQTLTRLHVAMSTCE